MHRVHRPRSRRLPFALPALLLLAGCGGPKTYPVEGKVTFPDGTPLKGGLVTFSPKDPNAPRVGSRGEVGEDGSFRMSTHRPGDGVPEGAYRVAVSPPTAGPDADKPRPPLIDPKFTDFDTSELEFTVTRGKNYLPLTVKPPRR